MPTVKKLKSKKSQLLPAFDLFADNKRWVAWDEVPRGDGFQKVPYCAPGARANISDASTWLTRSKAVKLSKDAHLRGVGIVLGRVTPKYRLCGVDLDECCEATSGTLDPWAVQIVKRLDSLTEFSPSRKGVKTFVLVSHKVYAKLCKSNLLGKSKNRIQFKRAHAGGRHAPGIEVDFGARYYTTTGKCVPSTPDRIQPVDYATLRWLIGTAGPQYLSSPTTAPEVASHSESPDGKAVLGALLKRRDLPKSLKQIVGGDFRSLKRDDSRSARDMALVGGMKRLGYSSTETERALLAFEHGAGQEKHNAADFRYFRRMWDNAYDGLRVVARSDLPVIRLEPGNIAAIVDQAEDALLSANAPIFCRGDLLVQPTISAIEASGGVTILTHHARPLSSATLLEELSRVVQFERSVKDNEFRRVDCPSDVANKLLARSRWKLKPLLNVVTAPTMRQDGSILIEPGYDDTTKLIFEPCGVDFGAPPERPNRDQAKSALLVLKELVSTFPFVAAEDLAVAQSAIITALLRPTLRSAPLHAFTAPSAGTGKSLLVDVIAIIATGSPCPVQAQGANNEESEKRIGAALLAGDVIISIDNCSNPLGGDTLCQVLTQDFVAIRILGQSKMAATPAGCFVCATGNNLRVKADLTRRTLLAGLDARVEHPEERKFDRNAIDYASARRADCTMAALTIVRAYKLAGSPKFKGQRAALGSFEQWSSTVRDAIMWAGGADPCETMKRARDSDPDREDITAVINGWRNTVGTKPITLKELCDRALAEGNSNEMLKQALMTIAGDGQALSARKMAAYLARNQDRIVDSHRIVKAPGRRGVSRWRLEKHEE